MEAWDALPRFELPASSVAPALRFCRSFNTILDKVFYDTTTLEEGLRAHGAGAPDLGAQTDPEGSLLVVDAARTPCITVFHDVTAFLGEAGSIAADTITITGVGSSALGSAALAWNVSTAIGGPVIAIVPGYGVADVMTQALGGWFGFGVHDFLGTKSHVQTALAHFAPNLAWIGRSLVASAPGSARAETGAPVFRTGCGSSDVLHALLEHLPIRRVVGHSKGALSIANALRSLDASRTRLTVVTLGAPIAEEIEGATYRQFLGVFDTLGQANAWFHLPDTWVATDHSTNTSFPLSMAVSELAGDEYTKGEVEGL